jgi:hypothetical protein
MNLEEFEVYRHRALLTGEMARDTGDPQEFFDSIPLHEPLCTSRELTALAIAFRAFREASAAPLAALLNARGNR